MLLVDPEKWKKITPIWFNWLGWFLALGAIGYVAEKTNNIALQIIYGISFIAFFMFVTTIISDILKLKVAKNKRYNVIITLIVALGVLTITQLILHQGIKELLKVQ